MMARRVAFSTALLVAIGAVALAGAAPVKKRPAAARPAAGGNGSDALLGRGGGGRACARRPTHPSHATL